MRNRYRVKAAYWLMGFMVGIWLKNKIPYLA